MGPFIRIILPHLTLKAQFFKRVRVCFITSTSQLINKLKFIFNVVKLGKLTRH